MISLLILLLWFSNLQVSHSMGCGLYLEDVIFDDTVYYQQTSQYLHFLPNNSTCGYFSFVYLGINNVDVTFSIKGPSTFGHHFHTIPHICFYNTDTIRDPEEQPPDSIIACKNSTNFEITLPAGIVKGASIDYISFTQTDWNPLWKASVTNPSANSTHSPILQLCNKHHLLISILILLLILNVGGLFVVSVLYYKARNRLSLLADENSPIS